MRDPNVSLIVAVSENNVIGNQGGMPWHLSADLKRFRQLTTGHHIVLGRRTFDSIGRLLPERTTIIVTRNRNFHFPGAVVVSSLAIALSAAAGDDQPFVIGGAEIYQAALEHLQTMYLTRVHAEVAGDTFLPEIEWALWTLVESERFGADRKNDFDYSFELYRRSGT